MEKKKGGSSVAGIVIAIVVGYFVFANIDSCSSLVANQTVSPSPTYSPVSTTYVVPSATPKADPPPVTTSFVAPSSLPAASPIPNPSASTTSVTSSLQSLSDLSFSTELVSRKYAWTYLGKEWTWELEVPQGLYEYYKALPRPPTRDYSVYVTHPSQDKYIDNLAASLSEGAQKKGYSEFQTISFALSFVQSLPYTSDSVTTAYDEYPRYPIETLMDNGGDCEDTAILMASLLRAMNYGAVLLIFDQTPQRPGHCAVGLKCDPTTPGTSWTYYGDKYYYLETTSTGWKIGEIPNDYKSSSAYVYPMKAVPILTDNWSFNGNSLLVLLTVVVDNLGSAPAQNVSIKAGFDAGEGLWWNSKESTPANISVDGSVTYTLSLKPPIGEHTRMIVRIMYDGYYVDESFSKWLDY